MSSTYAAWLAVLLAAACGDDDGPASDAAVAVSDASAPDASIDAGRPDAGSPPLDVAFEFVVPAIHSQTLALDSIDDGALVLLGSDQLVIRELDGTERLRSEAEGRYYTKASIDDNTILMFEQAAAGATSSITRLDATLDLLTESASPNGRSSSEAWAPGASSTWLLAFLDYDRAGLAELGSDGESRTWAITDWPRTLIARAGLQTVAGVPIFAVFCPTETEAYICAARVEPATGALSSVDLDSGHALRGAWMAELPTGVLVVYLRRDSAPSEELATSFHAALLDPDDLSILAGPTKLVDKPNDKSIDGLAVLGDYAYLSGGRDVFRFHVPTLSGWTGYPLRFPDGLDWGGNESFGVAVLGGELYHYVGVELGFDFGVLIQRLVPPPP